MTATLDDDLRLAHGPTVLDARVWLIKRSKFSQWRCTTPYVSLTCTDSETMVREIELTKPSVIAEVWLPNFAEIVDLSATLDFRIDCQET